MDPDKLKSLKKKLTVATFKEKGLAKLIQDQIDAGLITTSRTAEWLAASFFMKASERIEKTKELDGSVFAEAEEDTETEKWWQEETRGDGSLPQGVILLRISALQDLIQHHLGNNAISSDLTAESLAGEIFEDIRYQHFQKLEEKKKNTPRDRG